MIFYIDRFRIRSNWIDGSDLIFIELRSYQPLSNHQVSTRSSSGQNDNDILGVPKNYTKV